MVKQFEVKLLPVINVTLWEVSGMFRKGKFRDKNKGGNLWCGQSCFSPSALISFYPEKTGEGDGRGAGQLAWGVSDSYPSSSDFLMTPLSSVGAQCQKGC